MPAQRTTPDSRAPRQAIIMVIAVIATVAPVAADPWSHIANELPSGWSVSVTNGELIIARHAPVTVTARYADHHQAYSNVYIAATTDSATVALALRFRLAPAWSADQLARAQADSAAVSRAIAASFRGHRIAELAARDGQVIARDDREAARLAAFRHEVAALEAARPQLPRCTIGGWAVFDREQPQLGLAVVPTAAMREMYAAAAVFKQFCPR